jgi:hypothetical protein
LTSSSIFHIFIKNWTINKGGETMKMKRHVCYFMVIYGLVAWMGTRVIAEDKPSSQSDIPEPAASTQAASPSSSSFKKYPDHGFNVREYVHGMGKGGRNLLIWRDPSINLSQYESVKVMEFGGRLLPQQDVFSYDPYIALFNSVFKSSLKLPQKESSDALLIEGAVVECNPGSRAARAWVGFGAGRAGCAVACEVYEPGKPNPCMRIYTRDTGASGSFGGNSVALLNHIMSELGVRVATTLNTTVGH